MLTNKLTAPGVRAAVITLGCKVNQYESERIAHDLALLGYEPDLGSSTGDIVIINTCAVTAASERKSRKAVRKAIRDNPGCVVIVTGCSANLDSKIYDDIPGVSGVITGEDKLSLPDLFERVDELDLAFTQKHTRVLIKIQDGCDSMCSYCIVPHVRGEPASVPVDDVMREAAGLVIAGAREIVLTGINIGLYGNGGLDALISRLSSIDDLVRLRLSSIEVNAINQEILSMLIPDGKLCRHLHIPLQSGSDDILRMMNRPYDSAGFVDKVKNIRADHAQMAIVFDVMVGFPGETEADFDATIKVIKACRPSNLHVFAYSPRPMTPAARMTDKVDESHKKERGARLASLRRQLYDDFVAGLIKKEFTAIIEDKRVGKMTVAMTDNYVPVLVEGHGLSPGELVTVRIDGHEHGVTLGSIIKSIGG